MKRSPKSGSWLITLPLAAMALGYYFLIFRPELAAQSTLRAELEDKQLALAEANSQVQLLAARKTEIGAAREYVDRWRSTSSGRAALRYGEVARLVKESGARTVALDPEPAVMLRSIQQTSVKLTCQGSLESLHRLLHKLEQLPQTVWIREVLLQGASDEGGLLRCEITLAVFADKSDFSD